MLESIAINKSSDLKNVASKNSSFDSIIISLPIYKEDVLNPYSELEKNKVTEQLLVHILSTVKDLLADKGILFIYGSPVQLIKSHEILSKHLEFRYWIALDFNNLLEVESNSHLKHSHLGLLMMTRGESYIPLETKTVRANYMGCSACGRNTKDWGGKKHLMNINGPALSDIWGDFFEVIETKSDPQNNKIILNFINTNQLAFDNISSIPQPVLARLLSLINVDKHRVIHLEINEGFLNRINKASSSTKLSSSDKPHYHDTEIIENKVILGDCIVKMKDLARVYPEGIFDLVFADPPYNLDKDYNSYEDGVSEREYTDWCNRWLELCVKLTKPTGSLLILNLPKWGLKHSSKLNELAYLQNWIVWDALSTPKGKIMPAHYALLYYTRSPKKFVFNKYKSIYSPEFCQRRSCISFREKAAQQKSLLEEKIIKTAMLPPSDIWRDLHRIKHKKSRDEHPCQLPDGLMERIIRTFSNEGDLVFDPFAGAGTTPIAAVRNKRRFCTIEIDPFYKEITEKKISEISLFGDVVRKSIRKQQRSIYTKKGLEIQVQKLANELGRKPTLDEFIKKYGLVELEIEKLYGDSKNVLKASRVGLANGHSCQLDP